jgi:heptosyltransferase-2
MPRTILLFLFGDLGDAILTAPAIRGVRNCYPDSRLVLVGKPAAIQLLSNLGLVDDAIEVDKHLFDRIRSLANPLALLRLARLVGRLRRERADTVVLFHHLVTRWGALKFALLSLATGAPARLGLDNGRGWFLTERVADRGFGAVHEAEYWLAVAGLLGVRGEPVPEASISAANRRAAANLLAQAGQCGRRPVAIHAGTGWYGPGRRWPPERFAEAAECILQTHPDVLFVIVGTEEDREASREVLTRLGPRAIDLVGKTSVETLGAVLERCEAALANDGGVAHLASAVKTPVVAVFGPSNDLAWKPLGGTVVAADLPCRPCFYRDFERGLPRGCAARECLRLVTAESVAEAVSAHLRRDALAI